MQTAQKWFTLSVCRFLHHTRHCHKAADIVASWLFSLSPPNVSVRCCCGRLNVTLFHPLVLFTNLENSLWKSVGKFSYSDHCVPPFRFSESTIKDPFRVRFIVKHDREIFPPNHSHPFEGTSEIELFAKILVESISVGCFGVPSWWTFWPCVHRNHPFGRIAYLQLNVIFLPGSVRSFIFPPFLDQTVVT